MKKKTTIHDIAELAHTSTATVSRVLNNPEYPVKENLRKKVLDAVKELNYYPNLVSKQLKGNVTNEIGVIIPNITNPYYNLLISGLESVMRKNKYYIILCNTNGDPLLEEKYLEHLYQKQIQGVIISSVNPKVDYMKFLQKNDMQIVAFEQDIDLDCHKVNFDYYRGGYMATEHLIKKGHRDIGFISAPLSRYSRKRVFEGYRDCLEDNKIEFREKFAKFGTKEKEIPATTFEYQNGKFLVEELIEESNLPSALFCINDMTAFGVIQQLQLHGIQVPNEVAVIGFDNIDISEMVTPSLTTIDQSTYEMGRLAAEALIHNLEEKNKSFVTNLLQPTLIKREST